MNAEHYRGVGTNAEMELEAVYRVLPFLWCIGGSVCFIVGSLTAIAQL